MTVSMEESGTDWAGFCLWQKQAYRKAGAAECWGQGRIRNPGMRQLDYYVFCYEEKDSLLILWHNLCKIEKPVGSLLVTVLTVTHT